MDLLYKTDNAKFIKQKKENTFTLIVTVAIAMQTPKQMIKLKYRYCQDWFDCGGLNLVYLCVSVCGIKGT